MTKLTELLKTPVSILEVENGEIVDYSTVEEVLLGSDFYIHEIKGHFFLKDLQDEHNYFHLLGTSIPECLKELNTFEEFFCNNDWITDFEFTIDGSNFYENRI